MIPTYLMPLANHLWQSAAFSCMVALLCFVLRRHRASIRYWLWLAASVKFVLPLSLLVDLGTRLLPAAAQPAATAPLSSAVHAISQPFALAVPAPLLASVPGAPSPVPAALFTIWFCGFAVSAGGWLREWLHLRGVVRSASPVAPPLIAGFDRITLLESPVQLEPCVFGVFRPVLLLPHGIRARLTSGQMETILLHELCHVRRRDNLTAALHMLAETVFWFCPLVYWIGHRLMKEREAACDEEVLRRVPQPAAYAQGILAVCRFAVQAAPLSAAGVGGADLKRRIAAIMECRAALRLDLARKLFLAAALIASIGAPFWSGVLFVRASHAQSPTIAASTPPFAVASIKPNRSGDRNSGFRRFTGGQLNALNISLRMLIAFAYDLPENRILQGPGWLDSDRYDILAKPDPDGSRPGDRSMGATRLRTQALLADRFKLVLHKETRQFPIFKLLVDKDGPKHLQPAQGNSPDLVSNGHHVTCQAASMAFFAKIFLTGELGGPVLDETGITGNFDFSMDWAPAPDLQRRPPDAGDVPTASDPSGPSLVTALREQLGLKLEAGKGPVEVLIVDRVEKASEN